MPASFESIINSVVDTMTIADPIKASLVIVALTLLIVGLNYWEYEHFWSILLRTGVYIFLPVTLVVFAHYKGVERDFESRQHKAGEGEVIARATSGLPSTAAPILTPTLAQAKPQTPANPAIQLAEF